MIERYFPSKKPKSWPYTPPVRVIHQTPLALPDNSKPVHVASAFEQARADKMKVSVEVYRQRVGAVAREQTACKHQVGDTVYPSKYCDAVEHGKVMIVGICRHYDDYGTVEWNDPPFIMSVSPMKDRSKIIQCTVGWLTKQEPAFNLESC